MRLIKYHPTGSAHARNIHLNACKLYIRTSQIELMNRTQSLVPLTSPIIYRYFKLSCCSHVCSYYRRWALPYRLYIIIYKPIPCLVVWFPDKAAAS